MPTYEYECSKCGGQFEYFQSMSEAPKSECEVCGGKLIKLLSAGSGLIFKGSGFYITDYKSKGGDTSEKSGGADSKATGESKPAASETKKSETKPSESTSTGTGSTSSSTKTD